MRVVTMAILASLYYAAGLIAIICAWLSQFWNPFGYLSSILVIGMFLMVFWAIPISLNWSKNLYSTIALRLFIYVVFLVLNFGVCYYYMGIVKVDPIGSERIQFLDALYFSATTFTTLQYGEFKPTNATRLLACIQSISLILMIGPLVAAYGWMWCQDRMAKRSTEDIQRNPDLKLQLDIDTGIWTESRDTHDIVNHRFNLNTCVKCGTVPRIIRGYEILGHISPLMVFYIRCACGRIVKPSLNAYILVYRWNKVNSASKK